MYIRNKVPCVALVLAVVVLLGAGGVVEGSQLGLTAEKTVFESTCTVTIDCDGGGQVSCTSQSNDCTTQGGCVYCDGLRQACCPDTQACLDACFDTYMACIRACGPFVPGGTCHQDCFDDRLLCEDWCVNG